MDTTKVKCKLCGMYYSKEEMSEEHYPARSVGNEDIVALNIVKMFDSFQSEEMRNDVLKRLSAGESTDNIFGDIFDTKLSKSIYPAGRTARTLCRKCNTFLGKYDAAYLKHACFSMTNIFDIHNRNYVLVKGVGNDGGYHVQILMTRLFHNADGNVYG